jgi:hypothetical protein
MPDIPQFRTDKHYSVLIKQKPLSPGDNLNNCYEGRSLGIPPDKADFDVD